MKRQKETRYRECPEFRADSEGKTLTGYAALYNVQTDMGEFREVLAPNCFAKTIQESDIRMLWNHESSIILGRQKNGTLSLREDETGLHFDCLPSQTSQQARDCVDSIRTGLVDGCSFGFYPIKETWTETEDGIPLRELNEIALLEISPCVFPQYEQTTISLRSILESTGRSQDDINRIISTEQFDNSEVKETPEPPHAEHSEDSNTGKPINNSNHSPLALRKRQLQLKLMEINYNEYTRNDRQES